MCRCCWEGKSDHVSTNENFLSHICTRRDAQTQVAVDQIQTAIRGAQRSSTALKKRLQKVHGIRAVPRPLSAGVEVDTHIQSFWDASHLFFHNIVPRLLDKLHGSLSHDRPRIFRDRMATFTGARKMAGQGGRHFKPNLGRSLPMSVWQVRLMMATFCCDGIASSNWVKLITNTWKLSCLALRSSGLSVADIASSQKLCRRVIQGLLQLGGRKKNSESAFFDLPCVHGLKELFFRTLPALRNGNFATVDSFETHHRQIKMSGGAGHEAFSSDVCCSRKLS